jgi:hypothetical protein
LVPEISAKSFAAISGGISLWGVIRSAQTVVGISALTGPDKPHWTDVWFYGIIPTALYVLLALASHAIWIGQPGAPLGIAAVIAGLLLVTVRNEWDLVTWLAPRPDSPPDSQ